MLAASSVTGFPRDTQDNRALWAGLALAAEVNALCQAWLALLCRSLDAQTGLVLWLHADGSYAPVAIWPQSTHDVTYLGAAAKQALTEKRGLYVRASPQSTGNDRRGERVFIAYPVEVAAKLTAVAVVDLRVTSDAHLQQAMQGLHWGVGWLQSRAFAEHVDELSQTLMRTRRANDAIAVIGEQPDAQGALVALANTLLEHLGATRVLIGIASKGHVRLRAISNTASFDKRTQTVGAVENIMEEALDQADTVSAPVLDPTAFRVNVAHEEYRRDSALASVVSVMIPGRKEPLGVITIEHIEAAGALDLPAAKLTEAVAVLAGPLLQDKFELAHWFAGRGVGLLQEGWARLTQRGYGTFKLATAAVVVLCAVLAVAEQEYRVTARAVIEGAVHRAAVAPFRGYVSSADIRAGATVKQGDVLAVLDDRDLELERVRWASELEQNSNKYQDALAKKDRPASVILSAQMRQAKAQLDLVEDKLARSRITAPIDGLVVSGDLSQSLGSPIEAGQTLFEIAPLDAYRVVIQVDERDITQVRVGQPGQIMLTGRAQDALTFRVRNVTAVSEQHDGRNVFRVEADLAAPVMDLRPGMEGVGKIEAGERSVLWVWTHRLTDWVRLALWRWLP